MTRRWLTFRNDMISNGSRVNGTKYKRAGWAAWKNSDEIVDVSRPGKKTIQVLAEC